MDRVIPSACTQTEILPRAKSSVIAELPIEASVSEQGRIGDRRLNKRKPSAGRSKSARKFSPGLARIVLDALSIEPVQSAAARKAGIHRKTLEYWVKGSKAGHKGYDIVWQGLKQRFHEHLQSALNRPDERLHDILYQLAMGIRFKIDPVLAEVFEFRGVDAYATDGDGEFIVEAAGPRSPKMTRFFLEWNYPEVYGKKRKPDIPQHCGVLVIGMPTNKKRRIDTTASAKARKWKADWRRLRNETA
jgi:hypothetical protein